MGAYGDATRWPSRRRGLGILLLAGWLGVIGCSETTGDASEQTPAPSNKAAQSGGGARISGGLAAALADERKQARQTAEGEREQGAGAGKSGAGAPTAPAAEGKKAKQKPPPQVPVRAIEPHEIFIARTYTGRTRGANTVEIRTRVGGVLEERIYAEGSMVAAGDALFRIDQDTYQALVRKAQAKLAAARARQRQAEREWQRVYELYKDDATSGRERDLALSEKELAAAEVEIAKAELADVQLDLDYTTIEAPLSGVAGLEEHPEGSLIEEGAMLTVITQLDPIHVRFSIPAEDIAAHGPQIRSEKEITVTLAGQGGKVYGKPGRVDFVGAAIDESTGTVDARAVFPNPDIEFLPGQFVRVTLAGLHVGNGFRIPYEAVVKNAHGHAVFVLDDDNIAHRQPVEVAEDLGEAYLIKKGLDKGDRVVMAKADTVRGGRPVTPTPAPDENRDTAKAVRPVPPDDADDAVPTELTVVPEPEAKSEDAAITGANSGDSKGDAARAEQAAPEPEVAPAGTEPND